MPGLFEGLIEGFRGRADEAYKRNLEQDTSRRAGEAKLYDYLLNSRDPEIRALALHGVYQATQPGKRKRGFGGLMGEIETSTVYPQIRALAEQLVPDETPLPSAVASSAPNMAPATPGSAVLPEDSPVEAGSALMPPGLGEPGPKIAAEAPVQSRPITPPVEMAPGVGVNEGVPTQAPLGPDAQAGPTPAPEMPQTPRMRRRGTQVPTAEEIAEYTARIPTQTRIGMAKQYLPEEEAKRAIMGILGAPQTTRQFSTPTFAVIDPLNDQPVPVAFDYTSGKFYFTDGTIVPRGARFVRMGGTAGSGGLTSTIRDSPEVRAQYGIDPADVTPSGYWKIKQLPDGTSMVMPSEYTPPPAFGGTTEILERGTNVPVRTGIPRQGGEPVVLGDVDQPGVTEAVTKAQGLLASVDKQIQAATVGVGGYRKPVTPAQMDQITKTAAIQAGAPYQTYTELQQAAKAKPETTPRERKDPNAGVSLADRVRARAIQTRRAQDQQATPAPAVPSARSQGPGPRR